MDEKIGDYKAAIIPTSVNQCHLLRSLICSFLYNCSSSVKFLILTIKSCDRFNLSLSSAISFGSLSASVSLLKICQTVHLSSLSLCL